MDILGTSVNIRRPQTEFIIIIFLLKPTMSLVFPSLVLMTTIPLADKIRNLVFILDPYSSLHSSIKLSPDSVNSAS